MTQQTEKIIENDVDMGSVLGNFYFKFYDTCLAESITRRAQEELMHMVREIAETIDSKILLSAQSKIYSDTKTL